MDSDTHRRAAARPDELVSVDDDQLASVDAGGALVPGGPTTTEKRAASAGEAVTIAEAVPEESTLTSTVETERYELLVPADGFVESGLWLVLAYVVAGYLRGPAVVAAQRWQPAIAPDSVTTWLAVLLWLVAGGVVVQAVRRQLSANPQSFPTAKARLDALDDRRPTPATVVFLAVAGLVGLVLGAAAWPAVDSLLERALAVVLVRDETVAFTALDAATLCVFAVGFAVVARALDRLVVGAVCQHIARSLRTVEAVGAIEANSPADREADVVFGWFALGAGLALTGYWVIALASGAAGPGVTGSLSVTLVGALVTTTALFVAGTALLVGHSDGDRAFLVAVGLLVYAAVDTASYLAELGDALGVAVFVSLAGLAIAVVVMALARDHPGGRTVAGTGLDDHERGWH
ncbi:hypothetical protein [Haloarchaeobius sp. DFWS5]|uniref:hypothetical protein n=1 Tax=Haloarchaeobius sp. DFWS5 TaxID=3446114 RepID=UPI003EB7919F